MTLHVSLSLSPPSFYLDIPAHPRPSSGMRMFRVLAMQLRACIVLYDLYAFGDKTPLTLWPPTNFSHPKQKYNIHIDDFKTAARISQKKISK